MLENLNSNNLPLVHSNEFLPPISIWTTFGGLTLVAAVGTAFTLSAFIKYNVVVKAPALVRPSGGTRTVQSTSTGSVKDIKVVDNQSVQKGQIIATLDDKNLVVRKRELQDNLTKDRLQVNQVIAQVNLLQSRIKTETDLIQKTVFSAESELSLSQRQLQEQKAISQAEIREAQSSLTLAKIQRDSYRKIARAGAISNIELEEQEKSFKTALAQLEKVTAKSNPSVAGTQIAQARIAQERSRGNSTLTALYQNQSELAQRQLDVQNQMNNRYRELEQLNSKFQETIIRASATGNILNLSLKNPGQIVTAGELIAQISPSTAPLLVKAYVEVKDINKVKTCQLANMEDCQQGKVKMRISAYPYPDYGVLSGIVREVSADVVKSRNNNTFSSDTVRDSHQSMSYYEVIIQPENPYIKRGENLNFLKPGLEINAEIISKEETLLSFILTKLRLFDVAAS